MVRGVHRSQKTTAAPKKAKSSKSAANRNAAHVSQTVRGLVMPATTSGISLKNRVTLGKANIKVERAFERILPTKQKKP